jgi:[acyl-carrier-protein] S-malonyltransferase
MQMRFLACPGQGSQTQGFLIPWIEQVNGFSSVLNELSAACGRDLVQLGTEADEETIKDTANSQPLIVGASIAAYRTALAEVSIDGIVGHSVGEFAAAAIAGVFSDAEAMQLVGARATAMALAAAEAPSSMAAILGGEEEDVLAAIAAAGLNPANFNGAGQIVAAGSKSAVEILLSNPPAKARVIELKVAGAFHTSFMASAEVSLRNAASGINPDDPTLTLLSNRDGKPMQSGAEFLEQLILQVSRPVRWDLCMETMDGLGVQLVELPPAGALAGLAKRGMPNSTAIALKTPDDLVKIEG